jgi:hypothetical protein
MWKMKLRISILLYAMLLITSCNPKTPILFDEAMNTLRDAGYTLSSMNVPDMRCLDGMSRDGTRVVFMHAYCAIEDEVDWMTIAYNTAYPQRGKGNMLEALNLIGFPHTQAVSEFLSTNEEAIFSGEQVDKDFIGWRVSASLHMDETDAIVLMGLYSERFMEEVEAQ